MGEENKRKSPANETRGGKDKKGLRKETPFSDPTDNFGQQRPTDTANGHILHFHSVTTGATVHFKAFLTEFSDTYESEWKDEPTFGRMDPISTFQRTKRNIKLAWDVPAASVEEAKFNLAEAERFISMLYPVYQSISAKQGLSTANEEKLKTNREQQREIDAAVAAREEQQRIEDNEAQSTELDPNGQTSIDDAQRAQEAQDALDAEIAEQNAQYTELQKQEEEILSSNATVKRRSAVMVGSPLFKLKFSNLIMDNRKGASISAGAANSGLVGKLSGLTYQPDIEHGFFGHSELDGLPKGALIPQTIKFSCDFTVLHTSELGWGRNRRKRSIAFPYHSDDIYTKR